MMFRRYLLASFAIVAVLQTGCHGRIRAFFYRLTHCCDCYPHYGPACCTPAYHAPIYAAPACCPAPVPTVVAAPATGIPVSQPVFSGAPQPMPGPNVYTTPAPPPADKK